MCAAGTARATEDEHARALHVCARRVASSRGSRRARERIYACPMAVGVMMGQALYSCVHGGLSYCATFFSVSARTCRTHSLTARTHSFTLDRLVQRFVVHYGISYEIHLELRGSTRMAEGMAAARVFSRRRRPRRAEFGKPSVMDAASMPRQVREPCAALRMCASLSSRPSL